MAGTVLKMPLIQDCMPWSREPVKMMKYPLTVFYTAQLHLGKGNYLGWPNAIPGAHKSREFSPPGQIRDLNLRRTDPAVSLLKMEGTLAKEQGLPWEMWGGGLKLLRVAQHGNWNLRPRVTGNWSLPTNCSELDSVAEPSVPGPSLMAALWGGPWEESTARSDSEIRKYKMTVVWSHYVCGNELWSNREQVQAPAETWAKDRNRLSTEEKMKRRVDIWTCVLLPWTKDMKLKQYQGTFPRLLCLHRFLKMIALHFSKCAVAQTLSDAVSGFWKGHWFNVWKTSPMFLPLVQ